MNIKKERCTNMNHGRLNVPIKYCPSCGDLLNSAAKGGCDAELHASQRKDRHQFCRCCGKSLTTEKR